LASSDSAPLWYQVTFLVLGPLAAHAGGAVATASRARDRERKDCA
jgi:hypothetical protein